MIMVRQNSSLVVAIGTFDGVHRGHQYLLKKSLDYRAWHLGSNSDYTESSGRHNLECVAVTFDRHPASVLRPGLEPLQLTDLSQKINLLMAEGLDDVRIIKFDKPKSELDAREFVKTILLDEMHVVAIFVGENFRFGHRAAGDIQLLGQLSVEFGFYFEAVPLLLDKTLKTTISSTGIRTLISSGDVNEANRLLGRSHQVKVFPHEVSNTSLVCFCSSKIAFPVVGSYLGSLAIRPSSSVDFGTLLTEYDSGSSTISCLDNNLYSMWQEVSDGMGEFLVSGLTITPLSTEENLVLNSIYADNRTYDDDSELLSGENVVDEVKYQFIKLNGFLESATKRLEDLKFRLETGLESSIFEYRISLVEKIN